MLALGIRHHGDRGANESLQVSHFAHVIHPGFNDSSPVIVTQLPKR